MYSGLISGIGIVQSARRTEEGVLLTVRAAGSAMRLWPAGSVAGAGVCLTVAGVEGDAFSAAAPAAGRAAR